MDSMVLVRPALRSGLRTATVEVVFQRERVPVSDATIDLAQTGGKLPPTAEAPQIKGLQAATTILALDEQQIANVKERAYAGSDPAQRVYQVLVLAELCRMRRAARRLVAGAVRGDERSREGACAVIEAAMSPGPSQLRARVAAALVVDALAEERRFAERSTEAPEPEPEQEQEPERPETDASVAGSDEDSEAEDWIAQRIAQGRKEEEQGVAPGPGVTPSTPAPRSCDDGTDYCEGGPPAGCS